MQNISFDGYIGRFAAPTDEGIEEVFAFLNAAGRSPQVYARLYEKVKESVKAGLFWGIWKEMPEAQPQLVSTSAIFLHGKDPVVITDSSGEAPEYGVCVEHGATLRRKEREGSVHPKGVFMQILMAAPLLQLFYKAGYELAPGEGPLLVDAVFDNVQQGPQSNYVRNFIRSAPHHWEELIDPSSQLLNSFADSVNDRNIDRAKDFNRFFVKSIPAMAAIVLDALVTGTLKASHKGTSYEAKIDLSSLSEPLKADLAAIAQSSDFFDRLEKNISFTETRHLLEQHLVTARLEQLAKTIAAEDLEEAEDMPIRQTA